MPCKEAKKLAETILNRKGINCTGLVSHKICNINCVNCSVYSHDPYVPPKSKQMEEELQKLRTEVASLRKENATLKSRLRGDHQLFGGPSNVGRGGNSYRGRGVRGPTAGKSYAMMSLDEKRAATCTDWNRSATPGGAGGCSKPEINGHCEMNGVRLRHACNVVKSGGTHICWDKRHTASGHL